MWTITDGMMHPRHGWALDGSPSPEFAVTERATELLYYKDGKQVSRRAIELLPGCVNRIAP